MSVPKSLRDVYRPKPGGVVDYSASSDESDEDIDYDADSSDFSLHSIPAQYEYYENISGAECCGTLCPKSKGVWECTREEGHDGPHEAHFSSGKACILPWMDEVEDN